MFACLRSRVSGMKKFPYPDELGNCGIIGAEKWKWTSRKNLVFKKFVFNKKKLENNLNDPPHSHAGIFSQLEIGKNSCQCISASTKNQLIWISNEKGCLKGCASSERGFPVNSSTNPDEARCDDVQQFLGRKIEQTITFHRRRWSAVINWVPLGELQTPQRISRQKVSFCFPQEIDFDAAATPQEIEKIVI